MAKVACAVAILALIALDVRRSEAQPVDSVFVEVYNVLEDPTGGPPLTTYRIWVDLAKGHALQMIYGNDAHLLKIGTTTEFFNAEGSLTEYAHELSAEKLGEFPNALDSWLTIGAASDRHLAIPRNKDEDGSILTCPPYPAYPMRGLVPGRIEHSEPEPLCARDGLLMVDSIPRVVNFRMVTGYLGGSHGLEIAHTDGAWGVLGGMKGVTEDEVLLIAQISTTGELSYKLNMQTRSPDGTVIQSVASNPGQGELLVESLVFPRH